MALQAAFYVGTKTGLPGIYNRGVRWIERGPASHCELVFSDGESASASFMDKGVRFKRIGYTSGNWVFVQISDPTGALEARARRWFEDHDGCDYDLLGNVRFVLGFVHDDDDKFFCSEAIAAALGFADAYRFGPNGLMVLLKHLENPHNPGDPTHD